MMVSNSGFEAKKSNASAEAHDRKFNTSKTSIKSQISNEESTNVKRPKSSSAAEVAKPKNLRTRSRTLERNDLTDGKRHIEKKKPSEKLGIHLKKKLSDGEGESQKSIRTNPSCPKLTPATTELETTLTNNEILGAHEKKSTPKKNSEKSELSTICGKGEKGKGNLVSKKPSEIPKPKSLVKGEQVTPSKSSLNSSKMLVKSEAKEPDDKQIELGKRVDGSKPDALKTPAKPPRSKKTKLEDKVTEAMAQEFHSLLPLYEMELRKITEVWVNTIYCSLTMRKNLVKLLFQAFPHVSRSQFQTEDEKLFHHIADTKSCTKSEITNLIQFIRSLTANWEKIKEQYQCILTSKEIAEIYNYDWRKLTRKINQIGEETRQLQTEVPELQKSTDANEVNLMERIQNLEVTLANKDEELQKLMNQLNMLRQRESTYKGNVLLKVEDYKDIKMDMTSLKSVEKEFKELKAKFTYQNDTNEKKIKELEFVLEEKKNTLAKEKEIKQQLQKSVAQLQGHQKRIRISLGKEQFEYIFDGESNAKDKRREQLWMASVKLVLRGFLVQMKKLERDRNKMLLELQSNDSENFNAIATSIIKKEGFIKTIKHQMNDFQKAYKHSTLENKEIS